MSQWHARRGNAATPWTNTNNSCWNETRSYQDDAFWYITRSYEQSCWELEQNKNKFIFWPPRPLIFRMTRGYLLHCLIFPHSLHIFKDFGTQITNTAVFTKIFIFYKWVLFPIWTTVTRQHHLRMIYFRTKQWYILQIRSNQDEEFWKVTRS